jgi:hypothetical protein
MKTRQEIMYDILLALASNNAVCIGSDEDPKWLVEYAQKIADAYLAVIV